MAVKKSKRDRTVEPSKRIRKGSEMIKAGNDVGVLIDYFKENDIALDIEDETLLNLCRGLTPFEITFVYEYITNGFNATQARRTALKMSSPPDKYIQKYAQDLLREPKVARLAYYLSTTKIKQYIITPENVLKELAIIAFSDITKFFKLDRNKMEITLEDFDKLGMLTRAIKDIKIKPLFKRAPDGTFHESKTVEITLHPKLSALEVLARNLGLLQADENQTATKEDIQKGFEHIAQAVRETDLI